MKLEAGKMYKVSFDAKANSTYWPERIEAKFGTTATAAGMTNVIVEPTVLETAEYVTLSNYIIPETSGVYYIGLHAISDADTYYLYADNLSISEEAAITDMIPVGPAYTTPFAESFAGDLSYIFGYESLVGSTSWSLFDDTSGVSAQDGDNGFLGGQGSAIGDVSRFFSGKVKVTSENAALSFWYFGFEDGENTIEVEVNDGTGWQKVGDVYTAGPVEGWKKALVDLSTYKDKTIQFAFKTTVLSHTYTLIDNIVLDTSLSYDLKAEAINAPKTVVPGQEYNVAVDVSNYCTETASGYSVELYRDGALVSTVANSRMLVQL